MRYTWIAAAVACAMLLCGCNKKSESAPAETSHADAQATTSSAVESGDAEADAERLSAAAREALSPNAGPDQVVMAFLEATRSGDEVLASKLLSQKALEATTNAGLIVRPPGTPSMQYEIGEVEYPADAKDGAYVQSIWRERFDDGEDRFNVTWVLRKQSDGWRIVGMAIPDGETPYLVNFEEPSDLRQKMDAAGEDPQAAESTSSGDEQNLVEGELENPITAERITTPQNTLR